MLFRSNVTRVFVLAFTFGVFLAALGGAFTAPKISVQPGISISVILLSFAVVVIGGLGSVEGAAIAALIVGLARAAAIHLMPSAELFIVYLVMALVLALRPELVRRDQIRDDPPPSEPALRGLFLPEDMKQCTDHGAAGFPQRASADKGRKMLEAAIARTTEVVATLLERPLAR